MELVWNACSSSDILYGIEHLGLACMPKFDLWTKIWNGSRERNFKRKRKDCALVYTSTVTARNMSFVGIILSFEDCSLRK